MISNVLSVEDWRPEVLVVMNIRDFEMTTICLERMFVLLVNIEPGLSEYVTTE